MVSKTEARETVLLATKEPEYNSRLSNEDIPLLNEVDGLHRRLSNRQIQWIAIGGSIGTGLFVSIGWGLIEGGPGSLLLGFTLYCGLLALVNSCMAEMTCFMPVVGGWVPMGSKWVNEAYGFMAGWNFFLYEAVLIPFEISALNLVLTYWRDDIPVAAVVAACAVLYGVINLFAVRAYGESEFWLSSGKVVLIFMLFFFTFITMVGGNPNHDAYGFRYWKTPGSFATNMHTGALGRFEGFLGAFFQASFTCVGPEYVAMVAGEAVYPRKTIKAAFKTMYWRFGIFFILGALCVGIVLPYNDPTLNEILSTEGAGTGASSPYVIAMQNMGISVLPDLTNALMITSIFSAGNSYVYCATRTLYSLSVNSHAPRFLQKTTKSGVPIYCFCVTMIFTLLSFLSVGRSASEGVIWLANITQAAQLLDYIFMCTTYIFFYHALKAQNIPRSGPGSPLVYRGWWQPWTAWIGLGLMSLTLGGYGYTTFYKFDIGTFFTYYAMCFICIILFFGFMFGKGTKFVKSTEADLVWERPQIDEYERGIEVPEGVWEELLGIVRRRIGNGRSSERAGERGMEKVKV
ncbi:amino acid transporter-like protein [Delitschia confertaspora ATCC 74209]|uniref:Amino acid transporter-like protein n=1 Tax=Delitschia confertaspora ATCC 74209 TaxID=1513339 RepID=A0A9P4JJQ7_9PLEO|nr:amino acid transporter-like protein [Delitschia confertaspora ATCC 74209]